MPSTSMRCRESWVRYLHVLAISVTILRKAKSAESQSYASVTIYSEMLLSIERRNSIAC